MRTIGIDPGYGATTGLGWAVVDTSTGSPELVAHGVVTTPSELPFAHRVAELGRRIREVISLHGVEGVAVERVEGAVRGAQGRRGAVTSDRRLSSVADGWYLLAGALGLPYIAVMPSQWRLGVGAGGRATKEQIRDILHRLVGYPLRGALHSSDATAIAITGGRIIATERATGKWTSDGHRVAQFPAERRQRAQTAHRTAHRGRQGEQLLLSSAATANDQAPKSSRGRVAPRKRAA